MILYVIVDSNMCLFFSPTLYVYGGCEKDIVGVIYPFLLYGSESWAVGKLRGIYLKAAEMEFYRRMTKRDNAERFVFMP